MAYPVIEPAATEQIAQSTTVTANAVTVNIPAAQSPNGLTVINWIRYSGDSNGVTPVFTLTVNSVIVARRTMTASVTEEVFNLQFAAGWPIWSQPGSDFQAQGAFTVVATGPATVTSNTSTLTVGYTTVPVSSLRT